MKSNSDKFNTVIQKNTYYFFNPYFEEKYEGYINSIRESLLVLKNEVENKGLQQEIFEKFLLENDNGLTALLALTGFSHESLKRLITLIRAVDDNSLAMLSFKDKWYKAKNTNVISEWSDDTIFKMIKTNEYFRKGIVRIFFKGATLSFLSETIPLFELKKLSISKLKFDIDAMIDTLIRYKEKGSYTGKKENNPESLLSKILDKLNIAYQSGDLSELIINAPNTKRTLDFIIPNKQKPKIIIESSFLVTTSSGQGDKSKTEISVRQLIKKHYPKAKFFGFVDGIGWYVRKEDLKRMVAAYEDVFTFHKDELRRFEDLLHAEFNLNA